MKRQKSLRWVAALAVSWCLGAAGVAQAQSVCQWKDAQGRAQFGDCNKAPTEHREVKIAPSNRGSGAAVPSNRGSDAMAPARPGDKAVLSIDRTPWPTTTPKGWTARCDALAVEAMDLINENKRIGERGREIERLCPGLAYRCYFEFGASINNRCGPVPAEAGGGIFIVSKKDYPHGVALPRVRETRRDKPVATVDL